MQLTKLKHVLQFWTKKFQVQHIPDPITSAEYIIAHALGKKTLFGVDPGTHMTKSQTKHVEKLCEMRMTRMPVQYVLGEWDFHDMNLKMRPPVLTPRPETEELATLCMGSLNTLPTRKGKVILEIGPGTGAISLSILKKFSELKCVAVDISEEACELTRENADLTGTAERLVVLHGDVKSEEVVKSLHAFGPFCLVVSNPPYICTSEMDALQDEVRCFESHQALHGGEDGMHLIREVMMKASQVLQPQGHLWLEVGADHSPLVERFATDTEAWEGSRQHLTFVETVRDLYGKNRFCRLTAS